MEVRVFSTAPTKALAMPKGGDAAGAVRMNVSEIVAERLLSRDGIAVIWNLHLRAAASHRRGNWLSAVALIGVAEAAERVVASGLAGAR